MKTLVYTLNLKDDKEMIEKYKTHHKNVWPETINSLRKVGIINMNIYLLGRRLVNIMEVDDSFDPDIDFKKYAENEKTKEWDQLMAIFQEKVPEAKEDEWWALMENVFDINKF